jgi:hypothetical protein
VANVILDFLVVVAAVGIVTVLARTLEGPQLFLPAVAIVVLGAMKLLKMIDAGRLDRRHPLPSGSHKTGSEEPPK